MRIPTLLRIIHPFDLRLESPQSAHQLLADIVQFRAL